MRRAYGRCVSPSSRPATTRPTGSEPVYHQLVQRLSSSLTAIDEAPSSGIHTSAGASRSSSMIATSCVSLIWLTRPLQPRSSPCHRGNTSRNPSRSTSCPSGSTRTCNEVIAKRGATRNVVVKANRVVRMRPTNAHGSKSFITPLLDGDQPKSRPIAHSRSVVLRNREIFQM